VPISCVGSNLTCIIDAGCIVHRQTLVSDNQGVQILQSSGTVNIGMRGTELASVGDVGSSYHFAPVVDRIRIIKATTESAKIVHLTVAIDKGMRRCDAADRVVGIADDLAVIVDTIGYARSVVPSSAEIVGLTLCTSELLTRSAEMTH
jgi:hypothetical protein